MFIGHYAVGSLGRGLMPGRPGAPSLGTWFLAVQWLDLLWPPFLLLGIERVRIVPGLTAVTPLDLEYYPYTHSLLAALLWSAAFAAVYRWRTGNGRAAWWLGGGVFSHWVLDFVTHRPDLQLWPGGDLRVGLGLWYSMPATLIVEGALFLAAIVLYLRGTRARDAVGTWAWWALVALLLVLYVGALFGPPPPDETTLAYSGLFMWLLVPWAYWIDRHREAR